MEQNYNMLPVGTLLRGGTYRVTRQLKSGGFGNTYVVENVHFGETYAMKEFFMQGVTTRTGTTISISQEDNAKVFNEQKEKFKKEAQRIRRLNHPNIVKIHDLFEDNGTYYYVMDFIDGESLADWQKVHGAMPEDKALEVLKSVLDALNIVHVEGFTHMDITPRNIMLDRKGGVFLIDFGASKQIASSELRTLSSTAMPYSPGYAPTEQINQEIDRIGPWTDMYALGATMFRLLTTQKPPLNSEIVSFVFNHGKDPFTFNNTITEFTQSLVKWMMQPAIEGRPQSVEAVIECINSIYRGNSEHTTIDNYLERVESYETTNKVEVEHLYKAKNKRGYWGIVDIQGKVIIDYEWNHIDSFEDDLKKELATVEDEFGRWGAIDKTGKIVIPLKYKYANFHGTEWCRVEDSNGKWGMIDRKGKTIIPCRWENIGVFRDNSDLVHVENEDGKYGFIAISGNLMVPCQYYSWDDFEDGLCWVKNSDGKYGRIDKNGKTVTPFKWDDAWYIKDGISAVMGENGKYGFIDKKENVIVPFIWDYIRATKDTVYGFACVKQNGKWGLINQEGDIIIPCQWNDAFFFEEGLACVENESGKYGFIDKSGTLVIPCVWSDAFWFAEGLACVENEEGKYGFIDKSGKLVIPCQWDWLCYFEDGLAKVDNGSVAGYIDKTGNFVIKWPSEPSKVYDFFDLLTLGFILYCLISPWFSSSIIIKYTIPSITSLYILATIILTLKGQNHIKTRIKTSDFNIVWFLFFLFLSLLTTLSFLI